MRKQDRREQLPDEAKGSSAARYALVLNLGSSHCGANRCGTAVKLLHEKLAFDEIHESSVSFRPADLSFVPNVIIVRSTGDSAALNLIVSCKEKWPFVPILALICPASERATTKLSSMLRFVDDFLCCPFPGSEFLLRLRRILGFKTVDEGLIDAPEPKDRWRFVPILGKSDSFLRVAEKIILLAESRSTVLIFGETGTGKEVFSRAIHYQSPRRGKPFVPVNCGALPDHLFENELFGHVKGAFTDASSAEKGLIAEAEGGTLFLDEIDTLSQAGQVKLLRFLQDGEYRPVGSGRSANADVRVIAATNADLKNRVEAKTFREDLYYRLNALSLCIPPLRDRIDDVAPLTVHFVSRFARENGQAVRAISFRALDKLMAYSWPGNLRELESVITRALTFTRAPTLQPEDIELPRGPADDPLPERPLREAKTKTIDAFERRYLTGLLAQHQGNVTHAAKAAGKERRSFQRLLRKHNLDRHSFHD